MWRTFISFILIGLLLVVVACSPNQLQDGNGTIVVPPPITDPNVRPDIPRTNVTETPSLIMDERPRPELRQFLNATLFIRTAPHGIVTGDEEHPFLVGKRLGDLLPLLTRNELSILANRPPMTRTGTLQADAYVRFDFDNMTSGQLRFVRDPDTEIVGSELFFEEDKPIFEYAYLLQDGAFPAMLDEEIDFFGHTYVIHEANNKTIHLYGKDVSQYLILENNSELNVNGTWYGDTRVEVNPWHVAITYYAPDPDDDGVRIKPGETLRENLRFPVMLLNPLFDVAYDGFEQSVSDTVSFTADDGVVTLNMYNGAGEPLSIELAGKRDGVLGWGNDEKELHITECASGKYCIKNNDWFLLTTKRGLTLAFQVRAVSELGDVLELRDQAGEEHLIKLVDTDKKKENCSILDGTMRIEETIFSIAVIHNETPLRDQSRLSVDLDGDGSKSGDTVAIVTHNGHELKFPSKNQTNTTSIVEFVSPKLDNLKEEKIPIRIVLRSRDVAVGLGDDANVTLSRVEDNDHKEKGQYLGVSPRGILVMLNESSDGKLGEELTLAYPPDYRAGIVRILG